MASNRSDSLFEANESLNEAIDGQQSSWRSIAIAIFLTVGINAIIPYTHHYMHTISLVEGMTSNRLQQPVQLPRNRSRRASQSGTTRRNGCDGTTLLPRAWHALTPWPRQHAGGGGTQTDGALR